MKTQTVFNFFGNQRGVKAKIAKEIGISPAAVSKWGDEVPNSSAYKLLKKFPKLEFNSLITKQNKEVANETP